MYFAGGLASSASESRGHAPRLIVLFGLPGAGKTFVARRLAERGFHYHEGDEDLPADMRAAIDAARPVTPDMRDRFMVNLRESVARLVASEPRLVVAQTFLKHAHRDAFLARFPRAEFVLVTAPAALAEDRLARRRDGYLEPDYARAMTAAFDPADAAIPRIANDGDDIALEIALAELVAHR